MEDIICSRAWHNDGPDGPDGWRIEHLWAHDDGTCSTCDSDGDHDPFYMDKGKSLEAEVTKYCNDAERSWKEYAQDCAETGVDPLGQYNVNLTINKKENWVIWFTDWSGREDHGYAVIDGRHGKIRAGRSDIKEPKDFSGEVSEYLRMKKVDDRYCMEGVTMKDIRDNAGYVSSTGPKHYMKLQISYNKPRNDRDVARDVKAAAKRDLERLKGQAARNARFNPVRLLLKETK